jgi:hypothetical protein
MANKYWVGGGGNWDDDSIHWALTSGGLPGVGNLPIPTDDVFIDVNSGMGSGIEAISLGAPSSFHNLTSTTGTTYVMDNNYIEFYGSVTLEAGSSIGINVSQFNFRGTTTGNTLNFAGNQVQAAMFIGPNGEGGSIKLLSDSSISQVYLSGGDLDLNNFDLSAVQFVTDVTFSPTANLGTGTITTTNYFKVDLPQASINSSSANLVIDDITGSGNSVISLAGTLSFKSLHIKGLPSDCYLSGTPWTIETITIDPGRNLLTSDGVDQTINFTTLNATGTALLPIGIRTNGGVEKVHLVKTSGTVVCDWLVLNSNVAEGGATFYAGANSVDNLGNIGWIFTDPPAPTLSTTALGSGIWKFKWR